ncbi:hypothetical protein ABZ490_12580 [Streptomyces sp. NPDC005811]|uniref:hypothetical protein n=1 Tax=Streptomyces sp. NPDC005811 TaxID=3154565 RepID=UPI0033E7850D
MKGRTRNKGKQEACESVMTKDEWIAKHLRRAPARDDEWVNRLLVLRGRSQ